MCGQETEDVLRQRNGAIVEEVFDGSTQWFCLLFTGSIAAGVAREKLTEVFLGGACLPKSCAGSDKKGKVRLWLVIAAPFDKDSPLVVGAGGHDRRNPFFPRGTEVQLVTAGGNARRAGAPATEGPMRGSGKCGSGCCASRGCPTLGAISTFRVNNATLGLARASARRLVSR